MRALTSEITRRNKPVASKLSLHAEVPLRDHRVLRVVIHSCHDGVERPRCVPVPILSERGWEWFSTRIVRPRIIEIDAVDDLSLAGWRSIAQPNLEER